MKQTFGLIFLFFCLAAQVSGQAGLGLFQWRTHSAYTHTFSIAITNQEAVCAADYGAFAVELDGGALRDISKIDGLSETDFSRIAYNKAAQTLVIGYASGQIDLIKGDKVTNLPSIANANISGDKGVTHIAFRDKLAYLSCGFGIVIVDLEKQEVKLSNTNLDAVGNVPVKVVSSDASGDSIFLATVQGIKSIPRARNFMDSRLFYTWPLSPASRLPSDASKLVGIFRFAGRMYCGFKYDGIYRLDTNLWTKVEGIPSGNLQSLKVEGNTLLMCQDGQVLRYDRLLENPTVYQDTGMKAPIEASLAENGDLYVADAVSGLVRFSGNKTEKIKPRGPAFDLPFALSASSNRLYILSGGFENSNYRELSRTDGYSYYENNQWVSQRPLSKSKVPIPDLVNAFRDEPNNRLYLSSYGAGLVIRDETMDDVPEAYQIFNDTAGLPNTLISALPSDRGKYVRVTDNAYDSEGSLWTLNLFSDRALHKRDYQGNWTYYSPKPDNRAFCYQLLIDSYDNKWMRMAPERATASSVIVVNADLSKEAVFTTQTGKGGLPSDRVYDFAIDRQGSMWFGTGKGIAVLYSTAAPFTDENYDVSLPILEGRPVLENDIVSAITIDGGDRKWFGTRGSGLWLFDKDITKLIAHYNALNSPLPSDNITDLAIVGKTGELFVTTDRGMISLRTDATTAEDDPKDNCVRIFPNPVRPGYTGLVTIECLPENAVVKITDAAGRLIHEIKANGGTATWNCHNYNGRRASPGVYLVYAAKESTSPGVVGKIAIVE